MGFLCTGFVQCEKKAQIHKLNAVLPKIYTMYVNLHIYIYVKTFIAVPASLPLSVSKNLKFIVAGT